MRVKVVRGLLEGLDGGYGWHEGLGGYLRGDWEGEGGIQSKG